MSASSGALGRVLLLGSGETAGIWRQFAHEVISVSDDTSRLYRMAGDASAIIIEPSVPTEQALAWLGELRYRRAAPVIVVSRSPVVADAVKLIRAGAADYVPGPLDTQRADRLIAGLQAERVDCAESHLFSEHCPPGVRIVGRSPGMCETLEMLRLVAESRCNPVLILGETGTGKELAARSVHAWRCGDPEKFVAVNCAALTATLLESELFGHVKGAFTGADRDKPGLFELAGEGTIFLDEISEMALELQAKLLRVLQEHAFRRVGGTETLPCNATIVASSNRDLQADARDGKIRADLYYRLSVFPITLPSLADERRREDIPLLAEYFLSHGPIIPDRTPQITEDALERLQAANWPGNVRELKNVIERAMILSRGGPIESHHLVMMDEPVSAPSPAAGIADEAAENDDFSLETAEREFILRALRETGWQRTRAAALLGITRATLHSKLKRYGIQPPGGAQTPAGASRGR